jgi:hypothetical protein
MAAKLDFKTFALVRVVVAVVELFGQKPFCLQT